MKDASAESARFEPTVFGAVRRYRIMVAAFALAGMVAAIGYTLHRGKTYRARPVSRCLYRSRCRADRQIVDSEVLLIESPAVAQRAASIADNTLHERAFLLRIFTSGGGSVTIFPPAWRRRGLLRGQHYRCDVHRLEPTGRPGRRQRPAPGLRPGTVRHHRGPVQQGHRGHRSSHHQHDQPGPASGPPGPAEPAAGQRADGVVAAAHHAMGHRAHGARPAVAGRGPPPRGS